MIDVLSRWAHVGTAVVVVGGSVFMRFILMPSAAQLPDEQHDALRQRVLGRWKRFVHAGIALFLISGFYNYVRAVPLHHGDTLYNILLGIKMLVAFVIFFLASVLVGRSARFEPMRRDAKKWLLVVITLATLVIGISGFVKVTGQPVKTSADLTNGTAQE